MSFTDPDYVADLLDTVLATASAALLAAGRPIDKVSKFYGIPSWDCEQLVAWPSLRVSGLETQSDSKAMRRQVKYTLDINVLLLRCVTALTGTGIPSTATVDLDGLGYATDMWALQRAFALGIIQGTLFPSGTCTVARVLPINAQNPGGGLSAMQLTIEVNLG